MITADSTPLPPHARLIARPDVWMEGDAIVQFARVAAYEGCVRAVAMPDLHAGRGIPLGAAFAFEDRVVPQLIGGDAGCGVRVVVTSASRLSADKIERRARAAIEDDLLDGCNRADLFEAVWRGGIRALADVEGIDASIARLAAEEPEMDLRPSGDPEPFRAGFEEALGTAGGGNHFVEIARVSEIRDEVAAASRGLGGFLARRWGDATLAGEPMLKYLGELAGACRFARANRFLLAHRMLRALGAARASTITGGFDVTHNDVAREPLAGGSAWVHRKGAAPARGNDLTIVLGSRGAPSWILRSNDCEAGLRSVAHGAGRRMGRSEALSKLRSKYKRAEVTRTALGGRVVCADSNLLFEEHPDAYKPIEPVVESLIEAGLADAVAALIPVVTVKQ
jgi:release factor H-coupled RctB family protein